LCGRVHFPKKAVGQTQKDNEDFVIFRQAVVDSWRKNQRSPGAVLRVQFHFKSFSLGVNRLLSIIPIPFIIAQAGFRSKTWMYGKESEAFQGIYEWDTAEEARDYKNSFPMRLMKKRAVPGSLVFEICDQGKAGDGEVE
jgi:hypothetical protein